MATKDDVRRAQDQADAAVVRLSELADVLREFAEAFQQYAEGKSDLESLVGPARELASIAADFS